MGSERVADADALREDLISGALSAVVGSRPIRQRTRVIGGASSATLFRVEAGDLDLLVRLEGPESLLLKRNPHRFAAMKISADAGIAPHVHYIDEVAGLTITDFIGQKPIAEFPGGPVPLAHALGEMFRTLQQQAEFAPLVDYRELLAEMLANLATSGRFGENVLDPYAAELAHVVRGLDWSDARWVASHNDPNPNNILYDGERLWLIDWEAGYRNDPMVDLCIVSDAFAVRAEELEALLTAWLGRAPSATEHDRFKSVRRLTRLYYAVFLLDAGADDARAPITDLRPLEPAELHIRLADGRLERGSRRTALEFGKIYLEAFLTGTLPPGMRDAGAAAF